MTQKPDNYTLINDLRDHLVKSFPGAVESVVLFGSRITGTDNDHSDYDILIIMRDNCSWEKEREILAACYEMDLKYDIVTDVKILSREALDSIRGKQPFIQKAINHGMIARIP